ncbi:MAG: aminotransferase class V-fold PLP-dependent enzyme, partial [Acidobacteria bacterium]|nr:aminotransferase class V-fold PLP-dependent enzyme [Acidobacteriota bacterium]
MHDPSTSWLLDPSVTFLNHGSFGACPRPVLAAQERWRQRLEREPVRFMATELEVVMDAARAQAADFLGSHPDDLALVSNTTTGVNIVLRSLPFGPGDELLITNHEYNACANAVRFVAEATGASVRTVEIPFPLEGADEISQRILEAAGPRTRLALLDHVTSQTGLILPLEHLVSELDA